MKKPDGVAGRLAEIAPVELDGELWWEAEKVYRAFKVNPRAAARKIRREYKRRLYVFHRGYKSRFIWYLSRSGIETLAVLYGQQPRAMVMASLRGP